MTLLLNNLEIDGFRGLNELNLKQLGRVNLLVGKNNSGKTRVLEALRILGDNGSPDIFHQIAKERHELDADTPNRRATGNLRGNFLSHFFENHTLPLWEEGFGIGEKTNYYLMVGALAFTKEEKEDDEGNLITHKNVVSRTEAEKVSAEGGDVSYEIHCIQQRFPNSTRTRVLAEKSQENDDLIFRRSQGLWSIAPQRQSTSTLYAPASFVNHVDLAQLWDRIMLTDKQEDVLRTMILIDDSITGVGFIGDGSSRHPILGIKNQSHPISLGSLGDGVHRAFQLALNIVNAQNGFLLIDEFENGLHYTTQRRIWDLVFILAHNLNIQVFATTHSSDCIAAFAEAATNHPELGCAYHLGQSIIDGKTIATRYEEARLKELVDMGRDIR